MWFTNSANNSIGSISHRGVIANYSDTLISKPSDIALGGDGAIWFTNYDSGLAAIGRIAADGGLTTYSAVDPKPPVDVEKVNGAVSIGDIERYITDEAVKQGRRFVFQVRAAALREIAMDAWALCGLP